MISKAYAGCVSGRGKARRGPGVAKTTRVTWKDGIIIVTVTRIHSIATPLPLLRPPCPIAIDPADPLVQTDGWTDRRFPPSLPAAGPVRCWLLLVLVLKSPPTAPGFETLISAPGLTVPPPPGNTCVYICWEILNKASRKRGERAPAISTPTQVSCHRNNQHNATQRNPTQRNAT